MKEGVTILEEYRNFLIRRGKAENTVNGYGVHEVANQAGHSNIHTTLTYTNPTREVMKNKANKL